ncbi:MAG TPA: VOC family protein [Mucilaginibacter sp.]|nr:VOC family protein [Mucilaginibacter sp.]
MKVEHINNLVLTVRDIDETCNFYKDILGMEVEEFSARKKALRFGNQKLNLHQKARGFSMDADALPAGAIDICFIVADSVEQVKAELEKKNVPIEGIVERRSGGVKTTSIYFRDPDRNLVEVSNYIAQ